MKTKEALEVERLQQVLRKAYEDMGFARAKLKMAEDKIKRTEYVLNKLLGIEVKNGEGA